MFDIRSNLFTERVINCRNGLLRVAESSSLEVFKGKLGMALCALI